MTRPLVRRIAGWVGADGNPLRRRIDRVETALRALLVVAFLVGAPLLAPVADRAVTAGGLHEVRQESSWRQVTAVLTKPSPPRAFGYGALATYWVPARWHAPAGGTRTGMVPTRTGSPAGSALSIWVDQWGTPTGHRPVTIATVRTRALLAGILAAALLACLMVGAGALIRLLTNRSRLACWGMEWACFGPRWTARRWRGN